MCREMGCTVKSAAAKGIAATSPSKDLSVVLLPANTAPGMPAKKLADYFPAIKLGSKRGRN